MSRLELVIVAGDYAQALTRVRKFLSIGPAAAAIMRDEWSCVGWDLSDSLVEFSGDWKDRRDLDRIVRALVVCGMDHAVIWMGMVMAGMSIEEASHLIGQNMVQACVTSLEQIAASLAQPLFPVDV